MLFFIATVLPALFELVLSENRSLSPFLLVSNISSCGVYNPFVTHGPTVHNDTMQEALTPCWDTVEPPNKGLRGPITSSFVERLKMY